MLKKLINLLGGYSSIEEAIDALKKTENLTLKHEVLTEAVKHLFNAIGPEDVLRRDKETGLLKFEGRLMSEAEETMLKAEAETLLELKVWRVLKADVGRQLNEKMFNNPNTQNELLWGKLLMFYDEVLRTRLQSLSK